MRYNNKTSVTSLILMILFFWLYWEIANDSFLGVDPGLVLLYMNDSQGIGYSSLLAYSTFYCVLYLAFANAWIPKENVLFITRFKNRGQIIYNKSLKLGLAALVFATIHILVNVIRTSLILRPDFLYDNYFYHAGLAAWIGLIIFYWWIGLLFQVFIDYTKNNIAAILVTFMITSAMYFIGNYILPYLWTPVEDMNLYIGVLSMRMDIADIIIICIKQFILGVGLFIIAKIIYEEKDILENEK